MSWCQACTTKQNNKSRNVERNDLQNALSEKVTKKKYIEDDLNMSMNKGDNNYVLLFFLCINMHKKEIIQPFQNRLVYICIPKR